MKVTDVAPAYPPIARTAHVEGIVILEATIGEDGAECAGLHLLEAERENAIERPRSDRLPRQEQRGRTRRAIVVDVDDRNTGHSDRVKRSLTTGRVAIDISDIGLLDQAVIEAGVAQRQPGRFRPHHMIRRVGAGFDKRDHADTGHIYRR